MSRPRPAPRTPRHRRIRVVLLAACACFAAGPLATPLAAQVAAQRPERFTDWTRPVFPAGEYVARRAAALALLDENAVLLVPSGEGTSTGETFRQLDDFEYLAGLEVPRSVLAVDRRTERAVLFVPATDPRFDNPGRPNDFPGRPLAADSALRTLTGVDAVLADSELEDYLRGLAQRGAQILVNQGRSRVAGVSGLSPFTVPSPGQLLTDFLQRAHPRLAVGDAFEVMARLRMVKSAREIAVMREAARITSLAIGRGAAQVRAGVTERALTGAFSADCRALGAQRDAFTPIIKSGENSLWPWRILGAHYDRRDRVLRSGELVIYDVGCERDHYVSDVGRTFPVDLRFTPRQRELVEMVRRVSDAVIAAARPGVTLAELQRIAEATIPAAARPYMQVPSFFGHHLGLDSGDPSLFDAPLAPGMVFTIEPWYYNHVEGVAVFLEDELLITATGCENLTAALPRDATGLERMRAGRDLPARR